VAAFDVYGNRRADVLTNPRSEFGDAEPCWFISGDTRTFDAIGQRITYLKMNDPPTLEGLRQAFLVPETRVALPETLRADWGHVNRLRFLANPSSTWPRLTQVSINGGFHDSLDLALAPGLTAVIGGKGTGKSALVEILRYVLDVGRPPDTAAQGNRERNFAANAEARVGFIDAEGEGYEVERSGDGTQSRLLRAGLPTNVPPNRRAKVTMFGQRELHDLSNPDRIRDFVARAADDDWRRLISEEETILGVLRNQGWELGRLEDEVEQIDSAEAELADLQDKLNVAKERGVGGLLKQLGALGAKQRQGENALAWPASIREKVDDLRSELPPPEVPDSAVLSDVKRVIDELGRHLTSTLSGCRPLIESAIVAMQDASTAWSEEIADEKRLIQAQLADAGIHNAGDLDRMQRRAEELQSWLSSLPDKRSRLDVVNRERVTRLTRLSAVKRKKSRVLESASRELSERTGARVRLVFQALAQRSDLTDRLEQAVRGQSVQRNQLEQVAKTAPIDIGVALRSGVAAIVALGCTQTTATKLFQSSPSAKRTIEEADTPDLIAVEIDLGAPGAEAWTSVAEASPGQRTTALLELALVGGNEPLVIDQPEDDLDNRYIYEEVVVTLREVCRQRQVVVVTHNANIPILGDAELVIAFDAVADRAKLLAYGGLEDPTVAEHARHILEGGDEAFKARQRRYGHVA
jgi:ABC-type lipoprotein export system ATPase subunit